MPQELRLKRKYLVGGKSRYAGGHGGNNQKATPHRELTQREIALHAAQPVKVMLLQANGKIRMVTASRA